jgi:fructan beta-fructosidase
MNIKNDTIKMMIYLDYSSIELFADGGRIVITDIVFPNAPYHKAEIIYNQEPLEIFEATVSEIKKIW